jgi:hypothetical protein
MFLSIGYVVVLLALTDWFCAVPAAQAGVKLYDMLGWLTNSTAFAVTGGGSLIVAGIVVFCIGAGLIAAGINLVIRKFAIIFLTGMLCLAFSALPLETGKKWSRRMWVMLHGAIFSKLILLIGVDFLLGGVVGSPSTSDKVASGVGLFVASTAPTVLLAWIGPGLVASVGGGMASHLRPHPSRAVASVNHWDSTIRKWGNRLNGNKGPGGKPGTKGPSYPKPPWAGGTKSKTGKTGGVGTTVGAAAVAAGVGAVRGAARTAKRTAAGLAPTAGTGTPPAYQWWPIGAKPLAPGQPRPSQAPKPKTRTSKPPATSPPAPGSPRSAFPWFRHPGGKS